MVKEAPFTKTYTLQGPAVAKYGKIKAGVGEFNPSGSSPNIVITGTVTDHAAAKAIIQTKAGGRSNYSVSQ